MYEINESIEPIVRQAKHVSIDMSVVHSFIATVHTDEFDNADLKGKGALGEDAATEDLVAYTIIVGALQFCFWGDPKWTINIDAKKYDGSDALILSIKRAVAEGIPILRADYLASLSEMDLARIFAGEPEIPLFQERLVMLREIGSVVIDSYGGKFSTIIEKTNGDVCEIVRLLVKLFPKAFDDSLVYQGQKVFFYKKAQLTAMYLEDLSQRGSIPFHIFNRGLLSGLADYKAPQMLRALGILHYDDQLTGLVDNKIELLAGGEYEVEIRACTIKADALIAEELAKHFSQSNPALIHKILWWRSQTTVGIKPYHKTRTAWY